ncbi:hypothetical protein SAMD00023378_3915 [Ralstonia sp. NT80]|uniref:hypothetical protein n=1 Tax=Ralstonia sp. NT80 TaxID=1218247 RepID=UPI00073F5F3B|nr:hypothetical protein [Ralstonia sp. NT80]GAQ30232.1 hypothetical protein SAMD00023378_3915 [Ralstonia sp. NT80]
MDAVFQTTGQALHLSYLMLSLPATEKNAMRIALIQAMEFTPKLNYRQSQWLDQLRGTPSDTVNFGGLTMLEVRGQCSIVTSAVNSRLPTAERGAILARFGVGEEKAEGVKLLMRYARRACGIDAYGPVYLLAARHYVPKVRREGLSLRAIADKHGLTKHAVETAALWMAKHFASLEVMAMQRLQTVFMADGLVEEAEDFRPLPKASAPRKANLRAKVRKPKRSEEPEPAEA